MTTSAHEAGDKEQPLPGTENQQEYEHWDQEQRDAKKEGKLYEPEATSEDDVSAGAPKSAASTDSTEQSEGDDKIAKSGDKTAKADKK